MHDDDVLYHYTSATGLIGILGNHNSPAKLWLTQIQYMNDASEFYHTYELAQSCIIAMRDECPNIRRSMSGLYGLSYDNMAHSEPISRDFSTRYFSFSVTEESDLLSQWRGYAANGGYSIGFRVKDLRRVAASQGMQLVRCVYDDEDKRALLMDALRSIEEDYNNAVVDAIVAAQGLNGQPGVEATARVHVQQTVNQLAPSFKHPSFAEEREWRITGIVSAKDNGRARWRTSGSAVVPYCELDISPIGPSPLEPTEIVLGPGIDFELAQHAITFMRYDRIGQIKVGQSRCTLRR